MTMNQEKIRMAEEELTIEEIQAKHKEAMLKFVIKRT
jgi:hypothetical protein